MNNRDTMPLPVMRENAGERIGVIGMTPGSGVTFICEMLEKEKWFLAGARSGETGELPEIVDLSEGDLGMDADRILVVVDCRRGRVGNMVMALGDIKRKNAGCAVVLNRWSESFILPDELANDRSVKIIKIPEINGDMIKGLYSFAFYNR